jgi:hypothetical protein
VHRPILVKSNATVPASRTSSDDAVALRPDAVAAAIWESFVVHEGVHAKTCKSLTPVANHCN